MACSTVAGRAVATARRVGGGDINDAYAVELAGGGRAFVKTRADAAPGEYAAEAAGLRWLAGAGARVPEVLEATDDLLALQWLDEGRLDAGGEEELGRMLATAHAAGAASFGWVPPHDGPEAVAPLVGGTGYDPERDDRATRIGPLLLPNHRDAPDWPAFYAECRLLPFLSDAAIGAPVARAVEAVCGRLGDLAGPPEPPARLHGDLWSGNVLAAGGRPYLIDPAAYGGHREVDLAMLALFGGRSPRMMAAYQEVAPLADGHEERVGLWQLFPLLVHAVLFGGSYVASVERTARRYA